MWIADPENSRKLTRKTVLSGILHGTYQGRLDDTYFQSDKHQYFNIEILTGNIQSHISDIRYGHLTGHGRIFRKAESPCRFKFPNEYCWVIHQEGGSQDFTWIVNLTDVKDLRIRDVRLYDQVYDGPLVMGTIEAKVSGLLIEEKFLPLKNQVVFVEEKTIDKRPDFVVETYGDTASSGIIRDPGVGCWKTISGLFMIIWTIWLGITFLILINQVWPILLVIGGILLVGWSWPRLTRILPWLNAGFSFILGLFLLAMLLFSAHTISDFIHKTEKAPKLPVEITQAEPELRRSDGNILDYELIRREMAYRLPDGQIQRDTFAFYRQDLEASRDFRDHLSILVSEAVGYNQVMSELSMDAESRMQPIFDTLQAIQFQYHLKQRDFVELILSWVQLIPYSVVLEQGCIAEIYQDPFITAYLDTSTQCIPQIRYGILTPLESIYLNRSDCDSRTLLLFTLLRHFGIEVLVLSSEIDRHSVLGIGLPYPGSQYTLLDKSFTLVETTNPNGLPGVLSPMILPYQHWTINLLHLLPLQ